VLVSPTGTSADDRAIYGHPENGRNEMDEENNEIAHVCIVIREEDDGFGQIWNSPRGRLGA
jgi:hypothetical protein